MSEKLVTTRIVQKHDSEANWKKAVNFVPKKGELIIYDPDAAFSKARLKIGDGVSNVNNLQFMGEWDYIVDNSILEGHYDEDAGVYSYGEDPFKNLSGRVYVNITVQAYAYNTQYDCSNISYLYIDNWSIGVDTPQSFIGTGELVGGSGIVAQGFTKVTNSSGLFINCKNLTNCIGQFDGCDYINNCTGSHVLIYWPGDYEDIGCFFHNCRFITNCTSAANGWSNGQGTFGQCSFVNNVSIDGRVEIIDNYVFRCCDHMSNIKIADTVTIGPEEAERSAYYVGCTYVDVPTCDKYISEKDAGKVQVLTADGSFETSATTEWDYIIDNSYLETRNICVDEETETYLPITGLFVDPFEDKEGNILVAFTGSIYNNAAAFNVNLAKYVKVLSSFESETVLNFYGNSNCTIDNATADTISGFNKVINCKAYNISDCSSVIDSECQNLERCKTVNNFRLTRRGGELATISDCSNLTNITYETSLDFESDDISTVFTNCHNIVGAYISVADLRQGYGDGYAMVTSASICNNCSHLSNIKIGAFPTLAYNAEYYQNCSAIDYDTCDGSVRPEKYISSTDETVAIGNQVKALGEYSTILGRGLIASETTVEGINVGNILSSGIAINSIDAASNSITVENTLLGQYFDKVWKDNYSFILELDNSIYIPIILTEPITSTIPIINTKVVTGVKFTAHSSHDVSQYSTALITNAYMGIVLSKAGMAVNNKNMIVGESSFASGYGNLNIGNYAHSQNANNVVSGTAGSAAGTRTEAGVTAFSTGYLTSALGESSLTFGIRAKTKLTENNEDGTVKVAGGKGSISGGYSTTTNEQFSQAFGYATHTDRSSQMAVGKYNAADTDAMFIVGIGDASTPANGYVVKTNGDTYTSGNIYTKNKKVATETFVLDEVSGLAGHIDTAIAGIPAQAQADWAQADNTAVDYIKNKPNIPTRLSDLTNDTIAGLKTTGNIITEKAYKVEPAYTGDFSYCFRNATEFANNNNTNAVYVFTPNGVASAKFEWDANMSCARYEPQTSADGNSHILQLVKEIAANSAQYKYFKIRYMIPANTEGTMPSFGCFWRTVAKNDKDYLAPMVEDGIHSANPNKQNKPQLIADGKWHDIIYDLSEASASSSNYTRFRWQCDELFTFPVYIQQFAAFKTLEDAYVSPSQEVAPLDYFKISGTVTKDIGGIAKDKTYNNTDILTVLTDLLFPYVAPTFNNITLSESAGTFEYGTSRTISKVTPNFTKGSKAITSITIGTTNGGSDLYSGNTATSGTAITLTNSKTYDGNTGGTIYCTISDGEQSKSASAGISYAYYNYTAVTSSTEIPTTASSATNRGTSAEDTITTTDNTYIWFLMPNQNKKQIQQYAMNQWNNMNTTYAGTVTFTTSTGKQVTYHAYRTDKMMSAKEKYRIN